MAQEWEKALSKPTQGAETKPATLPKYEAIVIPSPPPAPPTRRLSRLICRLCGRYDCHYSDREMIPESEYSGVPGGRRGF